MISAQILSVKRQTGIYKITCINNGKFYIGSSTDLRRRLLKHHGDLRSRKHVNPNMQASWNAHGADNFKFEVVLVCSLGDMLFYEQLLIDGLDSVKQGFNICMSVNSPMLGRKHSASAREAISKFQANRELSAETLENMRLAAQSNREGTAANSKKMWASRTQEEVSAITSKIAAKTTGKKRSTDVLDKFSKVSSDLWATTVHREKMIASHVGRKAPTYTEEAKAEHRAKIKAFRNSPEGVAVTKRTHTGKKVSEETRQKMIASAVLREAKKKLLRETQ